MIEQLCEALGALASMSGIDAERLWVIGFCFGGGMTWQLATKESRLRAVASHPWCK
jgi:carboxymethylenebutenolidase